MAFISGLPRKIAEDIEDTDTTGHPWGALEEPSQKDTRAPFAGVKCYNRFAPLADDWVPVPNARERRRLARLAKFGKKETQKSPQGKKRSWADM